MCKLIKMSLLSLLAILLLATPVLAYLYRAPLTIVESSSNAYSMLPVIVTVNNQWMADNGFMEADALDTRVQTLGGLNKPHMVSDNRTATAVAVPANSQTNLYFVTGETDLLAMDIIVGYGGYVTIADAVALEVSDNCTIEFSGYIDTSAGADKNLIIKANSFRTYISSTDNITSFLPDPLTPEILRPTGAGDLTELTPSAGANWDNVEETPTDEDGTYVGQLAQEVAYEYDLYTMANSGIGAGTITNVTVYNRVRGTANNQEFFRTYIKTGGNTFEGVQTEVPVGYDDYLTSYNDNPDTTNAWTWIEVDALQAGIGMINPSTAPRYVRCTQVWVEVSHTHYTGKTVTATGFPSDKYVVKTTLDGTDMKIYINGVEKDSVVLAGSSASDNANDWVIMQNNVIPYLDYYKHTVSGILVVHYQPIDMIVGTVLPDREGAAQNGAITWGANPAGVSVSLGSMVSSGQPAIGATIEDIPSSVLPEATVSDWFGDGTVGGSILANPIRPFITMVSDNTDLTEILVWRWMGVALLLFIAVASAKLLRGHLGITVIIVAATMGGLVAVDHNIYPLWLLVMAVGMFLGGLVAERSPSL